MTSPAASLPQLNVFRDDVRAMHSYVVQDASGLIKLDAMENPYRLSPELKASLGMRLAEVALNRYPGTRTNDLRAALARHANMPAGYDIVLGNGSDELISLLSLATARPGSVAIAPVPGFVMYAVSAQLQGQKFVGVPLTPSFELDGPAMLAAIAEHRPALVYLAYPNNPTANLWDDAVIEQIVQAVGAQRHGLVVIDEAYQPFASKSYHDRLTKHPHVLLMRTLSKFGLAGVRLGYLIGPQALVTELDKVRPPYNISVLNCEAALWALDHESEFRRQADAIKSERERVYAALQALSDVTPGLTPFGSEANMILVRVPDAAAVFAGLKARGVLVKNVSGLHPLLANCIRPSVGLPEENDAFLSALKATLS